MELKILVLSENLERAKRLLREFYECNPIDLNNSSKVYNEMRREGRLRLLDGTVLCGRSIYQGLDRFMGLRFDQVFTDLTPREIPAILKSHIEFELVMSRVPGEFHWTYLDPNWSRCPKCHKCGK